MKKHDVKQNVMLNTMLNHNRYIAIYFPQAHIMGLGNNTSLSSTYDYGW